MQNTANSQGAINYNPSTGGLNDPNFDDPIVPPADDKDYDYKVVDGQWQFTKKGGKDWKNINKGGADVLNKTYPDALKKKKKKVIPEGRRGMIIKKRKRGVQFKKKDCGCKH